MFILYNVDRTKLVLSDKIKSINVERMGPTLSVIKINGAIFTDNYDIDESTSTLYDIRDNIVDLLKIEKQYEKANDNEVREFLITKTGEMTRIYSIGEEENPMMKLWV